MKKIAFMFLILTVFIGCAKTYGKKVEENIEITAQGVMSKDLENKHGLLFEKGKETPYTGVVLEKYPSGKIRGVINYSGGKKNGEETYYYETGELEYKIPHKNGKREGILEQYNLQGEIIKTEVWENGELKQQ